MKKAVLRKILNMNLEEQAELGKKIAEGLKENLHKEENQVLEPKKKVVKTRKSVE